MTIFFKDKENHMKTVRLTMAQALVRFLENQYIAYDGIEHPFVAPAPRTW